MKVLIVSTSDIRGGAARAAYRLHQSLLTKGVDSQVLVQSKTSDDYRVLAPETKLKKIFSRLRQALDSLPVHLYKRRTKTLFSPSWVPFSNVVKQINAFNPDVVHLHWVAAGMMRIEDIAKIKAPIVWSLHDMWAFTGGCHYDEHCDAFKNECGNCKVLQSSKEFDLSRKVYKRKLKTYAEIKNLVVVGSSQWITKCAKESSLFKEREIVTLTNCLDTELFKKIDQKTARNVFHIPQDKKVILFGAMSPLGDPRKGAKELFEAINQLDLENAVFVIAGSSKPKQPLSFKYPVYFIPPLHDEVSLPLMYNVADVMIVPSLQENLANSIVESLSCGVPVVAFDIGGNPDIISHKKNGYLVEPFNIDDMVDGIEWVLSNKSHSALSKRARESAISKYSFNVISEKYINLYESVIEGSKP